MELKYLTVTGTERLSIFVSDGFLWRRVGLRCFVSHEGFLKVSSCGIIKSWVTVQICDVSVTQTAVMWTVSSSVMCHYCPQGVTWENTLMNITWQENRSCSCILSYYGDTAPPRGHTLILHTDVHMWHLYLKNHVFWYSH